MGEKKWDNKKKNDGGSKTSSEAQSSKGSNKFFGCFICEGPHRARGCPKREKLNIIVADKNDGGSDSDGPTRMNPMQLLNALQPAKAQQKGLIYVRVQINGVDALAMADSGATHNFVSD